MLDRYKDHVLNPFGLFLRTFSLIKPYLLVLLGIFQQEVTEYPTSCGLNSKYIWLFHTTGKVKVGSYSFHDNVTISPNTRVLSPFLSHHLFVMATICLSLFFIQLKAGWECGSWRPLPYKAQSFHLRRKPDFRSSELSLTSLWLELGPSNLPKLGHMPTPDHSLRKGKGFPLP